MPLPWELKCSLLCLPVCRTPSGAIHRVLGYSALLRSVCLRIHLRQSARELGCQWGAVLDGDGDLFEAAENESLTQNFLHQGFATSSFGKAYSEKVSDVYEL